LVRSHSDSLERRAFQPKKKDEYHDTKPEKLEEIKRERGRDKKRTVEKERLKRERERVEGR